MFGSQEGGRADPAVHARPDCKLMKADPTTEIKWQEVEAGLWVAECQMREGIRTRSARGPACPTRSA
jgi:hypothetical protein